MPLMHQRVIQALAAARHPLTTAEVASRSRVPAGHIEPVLAGLKAREEARMIVRNGETLWLRPDLAIRERAPSVADRVWKALRTDQSPCTTDAIAAAGDVRKTAATRTLRELLRAGYVARDGRQWHLVRDTGPLAPRVVTEPDWSATPAKLIHAMRDGNNGDLHPLAPIEAEQTDEPKRPARPIGRDAIDRIWSALRVLRRADLVMVGQCARSPETETASYLRLLVRSGYVSETTLPRQAPSYLLLRDTGPCAPRRRLTQMQDGNSGALHPLEAPGSAPQAPVRHLKVAANG